MDNRLNRPATAAWLASALGRTLHGNDLPILKIRSVDQATVDALVFSKTDRELGTVACTVIGPLAMAREGLALIESDNPRLDFALALRLLQAEIGFCEHTAPPRIHPSVRIGRNTVIGNGVEIGEGTEIYHNVVIADGVRIGRNCLIKSCAVIGEEGYGFESDPSGRPIRIPHLGSVIIGDDVEVGSLTTVCRGTIGNTVLMDGCKIDDHVHIAHNVQVGTDAMVIACAEVSGSVIIGAGAWIAPNASILEKRKIGPGAVVGLGAVVVKDIEAGITVAGNPARPLIKKSP